MIEVPIGVDADSNKVCVNIIELDQRFSPINNKKLAVIQTEIIKRRSYEVGETKGRNSFLIICKVHFLSLFLFRKITLNILLKNVKIEILF